MKGCCSHFLSLSQPTSFNHSSSVINMLIKLLPNYTAKCNQISLDFFFLDEQKTRHN